MEATDRGAKARLERDGRLGVLVIDDPPLNLFGPEMVEQIGAALDRAADCRALLVRADGEIFTGGADVNVFDGLSVEQAEGFEHGGDGIGMAIELSALPEVMPAPAGFVVERVHDEAAARPNVWPEIA